jgi:pseudouridine synthase
MHPSSQIEKFYRVSISRPMEESHAAVLRMGLRDGDEQLTIQSLRILSSGRRLLDIVLHAGKKRHIRRMLESLGYAVQRLLRYRIGGFELGAIGPGRYHLLTEGQRQKLLARRGKAQKRVECKTSSLTAVETPLGKAQWR